MAGCESGEWHPLVEDFILLGCKLEKLGSIYSNGRVTVSDEGQSLSDSQDVRPCRRLLGMVGLNLA